MTDDETLIGRDVAEKLRVAFQKVQACKRGDAKLDMQPVWDIINLVPSAVALLDAMPEFERDVAAEETATLIEDLRQQVERLETALAPFAKAADVKLCGVWGDEEHFGQTDVGFYLTFGDLRAARAALTEKHQHDR
jgi:hypothetical protein